MKIEIPFRPEFKDAMLSGRKTATTRTRKYGNVGDYFKAFGATFKITHIRKLPLSEVAFHYYLKEGFRSTDDFIECWNKIHPRKFNLEQLVWIHHFVEVKENDT